MAKTLEKEPVKKEVEAPKNGAQTVEVLVLKALGTPPNLFKVQVVPLFENRYRVNVRVHVPSNLLVKVTKIAHSYYLILNEDGSLSGDEVKKVY